MHICVYCSSSDRIPEHYQGLASELGAGLARRGWPLVYGGASVGLMGVVARAVHAAGGQVIGIIPQALLDREIAYLGADELTVTTTMRERKRLMDERASAFVTLPGGFGTLEELLEVMTLKQLGIHRKPIIIVNAEGFFDPLLAQFERCFEQSFTYTRHRSIYSVVSCVDEVFELLEQM
jgi:uncharacterized protein (TIGR00730 family)